MTLSQEDLLKEFVEEAMEHLSAIENDFLILEKSGGVFHPDLINRVFRAAHSIKGGAGFIGLRHIQDISHKLETVLGRFRKGQTAPCPEVINKLLLATDALKNLVVHVESSDKIDISLPLEALEAIGSDVPISTSTSTSTSTFTETQPISKPMVQHAAIHAVQKIASEMNIPENEIRQARNEGKIIYILRIDAVQHIHMKGRSPEQVLEIIKTYSTFLASRAVAGNEGGQPPIHHIAFASVLTPEDVALFLDVNPDDLFPMDSHSEIGMESPLTSVVDSVSVPVPHALPFRSERESVAEGLQTSIRVNLHLLNSLMNLSGELVLGRNQLLKSVAANNMKITEAVSKRVDAITTDLQKVIMLTRMHPVGSLFNRFPRMVRNLSLELGKKAAIEVQGAEVELDRSLLEAMSDPLNHLIRNAVDHGIEMPDMRVRNGKPETGLIKLRAFNEAGQVVMEVSDDGGGIDSEKVASVALSKGFVSKDHIRIMSHQDKMNLIFLPGFSMSGTISDLSGRGVGMDVVKTNLDRLGGMVELSSTPGEGTRIKITLPLTLAVIPSQVVSTEGQLFAIPQMNLDELIRIPAARIKERIERVGDAEVVRLRNKLLPLVRLADILGIPRTFTDANNRQRMTDRRQSLSDRRSRKSPMIEACFDPTGDPQDCTPGTGSGSSHTPFSRSITDRRHHASSALHIALLSTGQFRYGLVVDAFHDSEEIVVKPLGRHVRSCRGYAGATIMGDGKVMLILDVNNLSEMAGLFSISGTRRAVEVADTVETSIAPHADPTEILVFRNAEDEQFALPLEQVIRIERIRSSDIQSFGNFRIIPYRGGNLPVYCIDEVAHVHPMAVHDRLVVIVIQVADRELGLLAVGPVDSVTTHAVIDRMTMKQPGIMGSMILEGKITLLVDTQDFARCLRDSFHDKRS